MVRCGLISSLIHTYSLPESGWYNGRIVAAVFMLVVLPLCLHGWGVLFLKAFRMRDETIPVAMGMGLAGLLFIGGILNLLGLAYPMACVCLLTVGLICSAGRGFGRETEGKKSTQQWGAGHVAVAVVIAVIMAFATACLLPSRVFNPWDDFAKYFVFPVRMLQTGSLFDSPLSGIGSATLGGKAFLDGLVIVFFPVNYLNGTDAVLGFFLCLILVAQFSGGYGLQSLAALPALFCVVIINPQCVNTSAVYLGSALIILAVGLTMDRQKASPRRFFPKPAALGLVYAGAIALKSSYVLFPAVHLPLVALALAASNKNIRLTLQWLVHTSLWLALYISPWILLHAVHFLAGLRVRAGNLAPRPEMAVSVSFFSRKPLLYGDNIAHYTWVVLVVATGALVAGLAHRKPAGNLRQNSLILMATAVTGAAIYVLGLLSMAGQVGVPSAVRLFAPFIIGLAPPVFAMIAWQSSTGAAGTGGGARRHRLRVLFPAALALIAGLPFVASAGVRVERAKASGSILAFYPTVPDGVYYSYNRQMLEGPARENIVRAQQSVPAGEEIIVWANAQFYMDFFRNIVYQVDTVGLTQPWAAMPVARYILWQHNGFGYVTDEMYQDQAKLPASYIAAEADQAIKFRHKVQALIKAGAVKIYEDGCVAVYKLNEPAGKGD